MLFDAFIASHIEWKMRLRDCIDSGTECVLTVEEVAADDRCLLGGWLRGDGTSFASLPAFEVVATTHAGFHRAAGLVVAACLKGERLEAEALLAGDYARHSAALVGALVELRQCAQAPGRR